MEKRKCSLKKHSEVEAIYYCQECKIYLCNKCQSLHSELFEFHHFYNLDKNIKDIFTGFCKEYAHTKYELELFCKNHNKLCCLACVYKFDDIKGYGSHKNCQICNIENIKDEKKSNLKKNINNLETLLNGLENSIKEIKILFERMNENKEELKLKIQSIFTKIRNTLNEREDELLLEVDNQYNELYINEEFIKESEKYPNKVKISLEKGKIIDNKWDGKDLNSFINDCINIENNIKDINLIKENIEKCNPNNNIKINFIPDNNEDIEPFLETIKNFGLISNSINNINSNIFKSENEIEFILTHLKNEENLNNKKILLRLLFQATKDGKNSFDFHNKCDGISPILVIIKTEKGVIFGGYTKEGFRSREKNIEDNKAFVFSFSKKKIYKVKNGKPAVCDFKNKGPSFVSSMSYIININNRMLEYDSNTCSSSQSFYEGITKDNELSNGEYYFRIQEIEVYQIQFK